MVCSTPFHALLVDLHWAAQRTVRIVIPAWSVQQRMERIEHHALLARTQVVD